MDLWWKCPNCNEKVDFTRQMGYVFEEDGEVEFDPEMGLWFHTIVCGCGANWVMSIGEMNNQKGGFNG
jgi:hypothetical protein